MHGQRYQGNVTRVSEQSSWGIPVNRLTGRVPSVQAGAERSTAVLDMMSVCPARTRQQRQLQGLVTTSLSGAA